VKLAFCGSTGRIQIWKICAFAPDSGRARIDTFRAGNIRYKRNRRNSARAARADDRKDSCSTSDAARNTKRRARARRNLYAHRAIDVNRKAERNRRRARFAFDDVDFHSVGELRRPIFLAFFRAFRQFGEIGESLIGKFRVEAARKPDDEIRLRVIFRVKIFYVLQASIFRAKKFCRSNDFRKDVRRK
jgi:hypothetical protein